MIRNTLFCVCHHFPPPLGLVGGQPIEVVGTWVVCGCHVIITRSHFNDAVTHDLRLKWGIPWSHRYVILATAKKGPNMPLQFVHYGEQLADDSFVWKEQLQVACVWQSKPQICIISCSDPRLLFTATSQSPMWKSSLQNKIMQIPKYLTIVCFISSLHQQSTCAFSVCEYVKIDYCKWGPQHLHEKILHQTSIKL